MFLLTMLVFVVLALVVAGVGMKMYVRPKEAMERVAGGSAPGEHAPALWRCADSDP